MNVFRGLGVLAVAAAIAFAATPRSSAAGSWPTAETYVTAASDSTNWVLPAHDYSGNRYLQRSSLGRANVARLRRAWRFRIPDDSPIEAAPIAWNGTVYVTSAHDDVYALDAKTGALKWTFAYHPHVIAFSANRGVALEDGRVYVGTLDGHLIALDAATGKVVWNVVGVHDPSNTFYTMAPVPYKNLLLLGASNGDWGGIGYLTAFDAATGKRVWEWKTVPGPGEPGHDSWAGDSWKRGGAAVWSGVAIDPATDTLYADLGNPQPDFLGTVRKGANLYSNSMVALDISGAAPKVKWYYQFVPHDTHDWDPAMPPVRFRGKVGGAERELVAAGDKAGNFWILDATNGTLVHHLAVSTQKGQSAAPSATGNLACPNTNGGVEFNGGSYSPQTNTFYVPSVDECGIWKGSPHATYIAGQFYLGGSFPKLSGPNTGWMNAVDVSTGTFAWRKHLTLPGVGGALTTATGLVFSGELNGNFDAYDAASGTVLWHDATGSTIEAPPTAYVFAGKQYVVVASGQPGNQLVPELPKTNAGSMITAYALP
ncbi:MAG TPA: PQQ-binding-like beta-propeller repeat protein [Candidatus Limnocylindria bacterium]|nr:PQQ-binding-like beta-propeller repeat protein [Candidatus Limnocylindria bacterium]